MGLSPQDDYLDNGFFRAGHTVRKTVYIFVDQQIWSTVWSRVPLHSVEFRKSHKKIYRRGLKRFRLEYRPYLEDPEQDQVYHQYQKNHPLDVGKDLSEVFGRHEPTHPFNTHSLRVFDEDKLVAFSCFDIGKETLASLFGCYLPDYASHSLGFFSMLAEITYAKEQGLKYYHPGYSVPGLASFEYKLRLPNLEGKTIFSDDWQPMDQILAGALPAQHMETALQELSDLMNHYGLKHRVVYNPLMELLDFNRSNLQPIPQPVLIQLAGTVKNFEFYISYDPVVPVFTLYIALPWMDLDFDNELVEYRKRLPEQSILKVFELIEEVKHGHTAAEMAEELRKLAFEN